MPTKRTLREQLEMKEIELQDAKKELDCYVHRSQTLLENNKSLRERVKELENELESTRLVMEQYAQAADRAFQGENAILPGFIPLGHSKSEGVVKLAEAYKQIQADTAALREAYYAWVDAEEVYESDLDCRNMGAGDSGDEADAKKTKLEELMAKDHPGTDLLERLREVEQKAEDADLLLGDGWQQVVDIAKGKAGTQAALNAQCSKLSGDVAELKDKNARLQRERDAMREVVEDVVKFWGSSEAWGDYANLTRAAGAFASIADKARAALDAHIPDRPASEQDEAYRHGAESDPEEEKRKRYVRGLQARLYRPKSDRPSPDAREVRMKALADAWEYMVESTVANGCNSCKKLKSVRLTKLEDTTITVECQGCFVRRLAEQDAEPEHCCGLEGFNPMKGDRCPACDARKEGGG